MSDLKNDTIRKAVMETYKETALSDDSCCGPSCCGPESGQKLENTSELLGYAREEYTDVPEGANMGLGCGNPQAIASLKKGETVLDLGSGGGFDAFLASRSVGDNGTVIGVDMTPEMISKARKNAEVGNYRNTSFRLGEIEHLPVSDDTIDVIISNCVINLSPEKEQVFNEAFRVLKPGGRLAISDIVSTIELPENLRNDLKLYSGCMAGASAIESLEQILKDAGFEQIKIEPKDKSREFIKDWAPDKGIENYVVSATIEAVKH